MNKHDQLDQIVTGGYCIGCGVCNAIDPKIPVAMNTFGQYCADIDAADFSLRTDVLKGCPFSDEAYDEDKLGRELFSAGCSHDSGLGYYRDLYVGHVGEGCFREIGASGGMITWLLVNLLEKGEVDHVVHVCKANRGEDGCLFKYGISSSAEEVIAGAKSRYYPVELSHVLEQVKNHPGRYVLVGLPCFLKAVRCLMKIDPVFGERIKYCVGLVCGHLKSAAFADCFAWQVGIAPGKLESVDFRIKLPGRSAGHYGVSLAGGGITTTRPYREFLGANWGHNFFRYKACDFCDDVFAETADIAIGDAWLPGYENDSGGNSVVVVRNLVLAQLIKEAIGHGRLNLNLSNVEEITLSQEGGLRDRREGLAYRLHLGRRKGWVPKKRVDAQASALLVRRRMVYGLRSKMGAASHVYWGKAIEKGSFRKFSNRMYVFILWNKVLCQGFLATFGEVIGKVLKRIG